MRLLRYAVLIFIFAVVPSKTRPELSARVVSPKEKKEQLLRYIASRSNAYGISLSTVHRLIMVESRWKEKAHSSQDAYGLMQVQVNTAREVMKDRSITGKRLLNDPFLNVECGLRYLAWLRTQFRGNMSLALTSYNRGIGHVMADLDSGVDPHNGYAQNIMRR